MPIKNQGLTVNFFVLDTSNNIGRTGDIANLTMRLIKDGGASAAPGGAITEPDSTNMKGIYEIALTAAEMNANFTALHGVSSTADTMVVPLFLTTERGDISTIDTVVDAIKLKTDLLAFTSGNVHSHTKAQDNIALTAQQKLDVNTEADTALVDINLDHLLFVAGGGTEVTDNSLFAKITSKSATADFDSFSNLTDSFEAIADNSIAIKAKTDLLAFSGGFVQARTEDGEKILSLVKFQNSYNMSTITATTDRVTKYSRGTGGDLKTITVVYDSNGVVASETAA